MKNHSCKAVFNLKEAASYLGISVPTLVRLLKSGEIPCRRGGTAVADRTICPG